MVGLLCLAMGAAGLVAAWWRNSARQDVWVTARAITAGRVLTPDDFVAASVNLGTGVAAVPASRSVAGFVALDDLAPGAVLPPEALGRASGLAGLVRLSVVVEAGRAPVDVMRVDDAVWLLGPTGQPISGIVAGAPQQDGTSCRFDVAVASSDAPQVARWVADATLIVAVP